MSNELTTLFLYRQWLGSDVKAGSDATVESLIAAATRMVERFCARSTFALATYRRWLDGSGDEYLFLPDRPLTAVLGVGVTETNCVTVKNASAQLASARTSATALTLVDIASGVETETELLFASYATVTLLAAAVTALGRGWSAQVLASAYANYPTTHLKPNVTGSCHGGDSIDLSICDELEDAMIDPSASDRLIQRRTAIAFPRGRSNVFAWYKAGYTLPVDDANHTALSTAGNVPEDLQNVVHMLVKALSDTSDQDMGAAQSESVGDYSYNLTPEGRGVADMFFRANVDALMQYRVLSASGFAPFGTDPELAFVTRPRGGPGWR